MSSVRPVDGKQLGSREAAERVLRRQCRIGSVAAAGDEVGDAIEGAADGPVARIAIVRVHSPGDGEVEHKAAIAGAGLCEVEVPGDSGGKVGAPDVVMGEDLAADLDGHVARGS